MCSTGIGFIRFVISRETYGAYIQNISVHFATSSDRPRIIIESTMYTNDCFCRFGQIDVYIRTDQILFQIDVIIKVVALVYFQNTIVLRKRTCNVIPGYFATSRNIQIGSLIDGYVFGQHLHPVYCRIRIFICSADGIIDFAV